MLFRSAVTSIPCRAYGKDDGLVTGEGTFGSQPGAWRGQDGTLYFSTMKGVAALPPGRLRPNTNPPPVTIESLWIDDAPPGAKNFRAAPEKTLLLHPGEERLEIRYASLNLGAPERARFRYRLEGYEKNWFEAAPRAVLAKSNTQPARNAQHQKSRRVVSSRAFSDSMNRSHAPTNRGSGAPSTQIVSRRDGSKERFDFSRGQPLLSALELSKSRDQNDLTIKFREPTKRGKK